MIAWTPSDGDTVHLAPRNPYGLPAGRYTLRRWHGDPGDTIAGQPFDLVDGAGEAHATTAETLAMIEGEAILTPIPRDELERERQQLQLRAAAPLRGNRRGAMLAQDDASGLALFVAANEPGLI